MNLHDLIAQLACEIYLKTGRIKGRDMENWLEAEWVVTNRYKTPEDLAGYPEAI